MHSIRIASCIKIFSTPNVSSCFFLLPLKLHALTVIICRIEWHALHVCGLFNSRGRSVNVQSPPSRVHHVQLVRLTQVFSALFTELWHGRLRLWAQGQHFNLIGLSLTVLFSPALRRIIIVIILIVITRATAACFFCGVMCVQALSLLVEMRGRQPSYDCVLSHSVRTVYCKHPL